MSDRENIIKNLEICASGYCEGCTYHKPGGLSLGCWNVLMTDAAKLLKEQDKPLLHKYKRKKHCTSVGYDCRECTYHHWVFDCENMTFTNRCKYDRR